MGERQKAEEISDPPFGTKRKETMDMMSKAHDNSS